MDRPSPNRSWVLMTRNVGATRSECPFSVKRSVPPPCSHPRPYFVRDFVIVEELLVTRKLHCFTLDDDEVNPFHRIFEQFRPARDLLVASSRRRKRMIEGLQRLKGSDHFFARREIGCGCLLLDLNCQRIVWIIQGHRLMDVRLHA